MPGEQPPSVADCGLKDLLQGLNAAKPVNSPSTGQQNGRLNSFTAPC